jgi:uncharacterized membrane protein
MPTEQPGAPRPDPGTTRAGRHRPVDEPGPAPGRHGAGEPAGVTLGAAPPPRPRPTPRPTGADGNGRAAAIGHAAPDADPPTEPLTAVPPAAEAPPEGAPRSTGSHRVRSEAEETGARRAATGTHRATGSSATGTHRTRAAAGRRAATAEESGHYDAYNYDGELDRMSPALEPVAPPAERTTRTVSRTGSHAATPAAADVAAPTTVTPAAEVPAGSRTGRRRARPPATVEPPTGHGHGHSPAPPSGRRVRILIAALLVPCGVAALVGLALLFPRGGLPTPPATLNQQPVHATVTQASASDCTPGSGDKACVTLLLAMVDGPQPGRDLVQVVPVEPSTPKFAVGDKVVLSYSGGDATDPGSYQVVDFQRSQPLIYLAGLFAAAVLVLGRWRGLAALAALGLSFAVLLFFVLPAILAGRDPLAVAVVGSGLIMFAVLYLTHGFSARTSVAVLGTLVSLALIGGLGAAFAAASSLTGLDDQTANLIATLGTGVDARGLLLAGVVIGALGVLDDVTVTQTSAVWELRRADPAMGPGELFGAAMRIGRDHVASAVNTLVLAYAGAALPLMLLFSLSGRAIGDVLTTQDVATEIIRTLVGSIGLVASVPITTALAAVVASREQSPLTRV